MRCSACGELVGQEQDRCPSCGTPVRYAISPFPAGVGPSVKRCPRCDYFGEGVPYFRTPGHVALLIGAGFFTWGVGALVYWLARRRHRVCPNCGLAWHRASPTTIVPRERDTPPASGASFEESLPPSGIGRRVLGTLLILVASLVIMLGFVEVEAAAVVVGGVMGAGGGATFFWGWSALQERRRALTRTLEKRVLHLAAVRGGALTVTEVAAELGLSIPAAERVLIGMDDGFRVRSDVTREGLVLYEFPEVKHRPRLEAP